MIIKIIMIKIIIIIITIIIIIIIIIIMMISIFDIAPFPLIMFTIWVCYVPCRNYTVRKMPTPITDASVALRAQPERTQAALQKIEVLLQRNHSPRKFASDQAYRLQQGFLISSTQQVL